MFCLFTMKDLFIFFNVIKMVLTCSYPICYNLYRKKKSIQICNLSLKVFFHNMFLMFAICQYVTENLCPKLLSMIIEPISDSEAV